MNPHDRDEHDASCNGMSPCDMATDLDQLLEDISVHEPGMWENNKGPKGWFAVSREDEGGIIAYFQHGSHAYAYRLFLANAALNPLD